MRAKILRYLAVGLLLGPVLPSCQKDPSTSGLHDDYTVYTACDEQADFAAFSTYYLPDSILLIGNADKTEYWKDADAQQIIATVAANMTAAGYSRTDDKAAADVGL